MRNISITLQLRKQFRLIKMAIHTYTLKEIVRNNGAVCDFLSTCVTYEISQSAFIVMDESVRILNDRKPWVQSNPLQFIHNYINSCFSIARFSAASIPLTS